MNLTSVDNVAKPAFESAIDRGPLLLQALWRAQKRMGIIGTWLREETRLTEAMLAVSLEGADLHSLFAVRILHEMRSAVKNVLLVKGFSCESLRSADDPDVELIDGQVLFGTEKLAYQTVDMIGVDRLIRLLEWPDSISFVLGGIATEDGKLLEIKAESDVLLLGVYVQAFDGEGGLMWVRQEWMNLNGGRAEDVGP